MPRYFLEIAYKGTKYNGFQVQENANTIQSEVEKAFKLLHRQPVSLTGSSRTDTGVHALQNFFHFDLDDVHPQLVYKMNAILPADIAIKNIYSMPPEAHARFDAISRQYQYRIHRFKDPFSESTSFFFPYKLDIARMNEAAAWLKDQTNFFAFAKTNTQVKTFECTIFSSEWIVEDDRIMYQITANRFLRGMVRLITATLLRIGRHRLSLEEFCELFTDQKKSGHSVPPQGLFLKSVRYPENYFPATGLSFTAF
jgi:tRNA pseudouridine38-40 synthase